MVLPVYSPFDGNISKLVYHLFESYPENFIDKFKEHIVDNLELMSNLSQVTTLNDPNNIKTTENGVIVHFRGMIQDCMESEYFYPYYKKINGGSCTTNCGYFVDPVHFSEDDCLADEHTLKERFCYNVVSQPHQSDWALNNLLNNFKASHSNKQSRSQLDPIPEITIKVYEQNRLKLNESMDFYGVLSFGESLSIHAIYYEPVRLLDSRKLPILNTESIKFYRNILVESLSPYFHGDTLSVEYFLCCLISSCDSGIDQGNFTLNFFGLNNSDYHYFRSFIYNIVSILIPYRTMFTLTTENLNTARMIPYKDYETGRLCTGLLQMSPRTVFIVDECGLTDGRLTEQGVTNLQALVNLVSSQKVAYDFKFYECDFFANLRVISVSQSSSILNCRYSLPLECSGTCMDSSAESCLGDLVGPFRACLASVQQASFKIPSYINKVLEDFFVESRRLTQGSGNMYTSEDFHSLLLLCRMLTLLEGQVELSEEIWNKAVLMEEARKRRLSLHKSQ